MKKALVLLLFNVFFINAQKSQVMTDRKNLDQKNKAELIQIGLEIIKKKQPSLVIDYDDFEITAWKNSKEIVVKFRRYIRFIPLNTEPYQYYDITINLITKQILPFESGYNFSFYIPSEEDEKKLNFIKSKAEFPKHPESEIIITENNDHYWVSNKSKTSFSKFFINKETGFKSGLLEGTYSVPQAKPVFESLYDREEKIKLFEGDETSKKRIIDMAVTLLNKKQPLLKLDFNDYETTVLGDSKNTLVEFRRIIRYVPFGTDPENRFSYDITVNLNTNEISPFDDDKFFKSEFYIETNEDKKAVKFLKKNFDIFSPDFENTVYEGEEDYYIDRKNQYSFGKYSVNKKTGIGKPEIQASYERMPQPDFTKDLDIFIEIN